MIRPEFYTLPKAMYELDGIRVVLADDENAILHKKLDTSNLDMEKIIVSHLTKFTNFFNPNKTSVETSFKEIVDESISIIGSKLESEGITIDIEVEPEQKIQSFKEELMQVIMDMMKNSADFLKSTTFIRQKLL